MEKTVKLSGLVSERELPKVPKESNPKKFLEGFYGSEFYTNAYEDFFKDKNLAPGVTEADKRRTFLDGEKAKFALVDYGCDEIGLEYDESHYSARARFAISKYIEVSRKFNIASVVGVSDDALIKINSNKFAIHDTVGKQLTEDGITPNDKIGRAFGRLILIDKKLDTPSAARTSDIERVKARMKL